MKSRWRLSRAAGQTVILDMNVSKVPDMPAGVRVGAVLGRAQPTITSST